MRILNLFFAALGVLGLIAVRMFEEQLFYDPFLAYFQGDFHSLPFPEFSTGRLVWSHFVRFVLNTVLSAVVLQFLFLEKRWTLQAVVLMTGAFLVLFPIYLGCLFTQMELGTLFTFSVRKFLIQPVLLLLFVAVFYYRKKLQQP